MGAAKKCLGGTKFQLAIFESVKAKVKEKVWTGESEIVKVWKWKCAVKKSLGGTKFQLAIFESVKLKEKVWTCESEIVKVKVCSQEKLRWH